MHHPTHRIAHTTSFVKPVVEHWLEQEIAQWVSAITACRLFEELSVVLMLENQYVAALV